MYGKTRNSIKIFHILVSTLFLQEPQVQIQAAPSDKIRCVLSEIIIWLLLKVAIHIHMLLLFTFHQLVRQQSLYDVYHLIGLLISCYQTLINIISASTKHNLCKHCFRVFVETIIKLHKVLLSSNAAAAAKRKEHENVLNKKTVVDAK